jgi:hypothetical protein
MGVLERYRAHLALSLVVVTVGVVAMPRWFYRGDPRAVRFGTAQLIEAGSFGVPFSERARVPQFLVAYRGMMLFENDASERLYSKGRLLNSLLVLPPMAVERLYSGPLDLHQDTESLLLLLNAHNILVSVVIALYMLALGRRYTRRVWLAAGVAFCGLFGSYLWYYLRAQAGEIFQMWFLLGFVAHLLAWNDRRASGRRGTSGFLLAMLYGVLLTQTKPYYGLVFPLAWLALVLVAPRSSRLRVARAEALRLGGFAALAAGCVLLENTRVFGGPLSFGYDQFEQAGAQVDHFDPAILLDSVPGFLFRMDRSILTHLPLLLLVPFSVPVLMRRQRLDLLLAGLFLGVFVLLIGSYSMWPGDWCYGPRYLVFLSPFLAMLSVPALDRLVDGMGRSRVWWAGALVVTGTILWSGWLQTRVNALEFHARYEAQHRYRPFEDDAIDRYFTRSHSGIIAADLMALRDGRPFPPSQWALALHPTAGSQVEAIERGLRRHFVLRSNYYWQSE